MKRASCAVAILLFAFILGCSGKGGSGEKATEGTSAPGKTASEQAEKDQFRKIVQQNAADPKNFEIVIWGNKGLTRPVRFRCNLVGQGKQGPVMLEYAYIEYSGDKISRVSCDLIHTCWYPEK